MAYTHKLGIGFTTTKEHTSEIYGLVANLQRTLPLGFACVPGVSVPHLTLMQGTFESEEAVIEKARSLDLGDLVATQDVQGLSVFDGKIVFLDCVKNSAIDKAHRAAFAALFPLCEGKPADPQPFPNITAGQRKMYNETGYLFALDEYLPHFTLAHLAELVNDPKPHEFRMNELLGKTAVAKKVVFDKLIVYRVGPKGACSQIVYERKL